MFSWLVTTKSVTLAGLKRAGANSKPHLYTHSTKNEGPPENMDFKGKTDWRFHTKRTETLLSTFQKNSAGEQDPEAINWISPLQAVRIKLNKTRKKAFLLKLLELCKTRAKKSSPDMFNFYVVLAGHSKVSDAGRAATCWLKFKAPSLKTKSTKNEGPFGNMNKFS